MEIDVTKKINVLTKTNNKIRFRSSSNAEDLEFFNSAGLYDSKSAYLKFNEQMIEKEKKKTIARAIKKVWASVWSFRAFEERDFYRIDHMSAYMGVLVQPSYSSDIEKANGVFTTTEDSYRVKLTLNAAEGDKSITHPDSTDTRLSNFFIISKNKKINEFSIIESISDWQKVMSQTEVENLTNKSLLVHQHIEKVYGKKLQLDYEFKLLGDNRDLLIKQVRPLTQSVNAKVYGLPKTVKKSIFSVTAYPYIYNASFEGDTISYVEKNYGIMGDEPKASYIKITFNKNVSNFKAGEVIEITKEDNYDTTTIGHPFMHHGPMTFLLLQKSP